MESLEIYFRRRVPMRSPSPRRTESEVLGSGMAMTVLNAPDGPDCHARPGFESSGEVSPLARPIRTTGP